MTSHAPHTVRAGRLAVELTCLFARDTELAVGLDDAQRRLREANDRLWSGLDPDGLRAIYGDHPRFEAVQLQAALDGRCEVLDCADPLGALQRRTGRSTEHTSNTSRPLRIAGSSPLTSGSSSPGSSTR